MCYVYIYICVICTCIQDVLYAQYGHRYEVLYEVYVYTCIYDDVSVHIPYICIYMILLSFSLSLSLYIYILDVKMGLKPHLYSITSVTPMLTPDAKARC